MNPFIAELLRAEREWPIDLRVMPDQSPPGVWAVRTGDVEKGMPAVLILGEPYHPVEILMARLTGWGGVWDNPAPAAGITRMLAYRQEGRVGHPEYDELFQLLTPTRPGLDAERRAVYNMLGFYDRDADLISEKVRAK